MGKIEKPTFFSGMTRTVAILLSLVPYSNADSSTGRDKEQLSLNVALSIYHVPFSNLDSQC